MSVFSLSGVLCCVLLLFCAAASPLLAKAGIRRADVTAAGAWRSTLLFLFLLLPGFFGGFSFREVFASLSGFRQWLFFLLGLAMAGGAWLLYNNALKHGTVVRTISLLFILPLPLFLLSLWLFPETRFSPFTKSGLTAIFAMLAFFVALILLCVHQTGKWDTERASHAASCHRCAYLLPFYAAFPHRGEHSALYSPFCSAFMAFAPFRGSPLPCF